MRKPAYALVIVALLTIVIAACSAPSEDPASSGVLDGKSLAEEQCSVCHPYSRVEAAKKTPEEWKTTVERMVAKGAKLNEAEQAAVIEYLSEAYP
jgi:quinohemoprotein amine dehydrogenase